MKITCTNDIMDRVMNEEFIPVEDTPEQAAIAYFKQVWAAYVAAGEKADAAFLRYFKKAQAGERTNAAQATRLQNEASYLSTDVYNAASALWRLDINPITVVPEYDLG